MAFLCLRFLKMRNQLREAHVKSRRLKPQMERKRLENRLGGRRAGELLLLEAMDPLRLRTRLSRNWAFRDRKQLRRTQVEWSTQVPECERKNICMQIAHTHTHHFLFEIATARLPLIMNYTRRGLVWCKFTSAVEMNSYWILRVTKGFRFSNAQIKKGVTATVERLPLKRRIYLLDAHPI